MIESVWTQRRRKTAVPSLICKSNEWYTPAPLIHAASSLMGGIELDLASCALANKGVQAERYYDLQADGLSQSWSARSVWLNPPYGRTGKHESSQEIWSCKLIAEYQMGHTLQALLLVNAATETGWFQRLWRYPLCFVKGRIRFYTTDGQTGGPTFGSVLVYFGPQSERFRALFLPFGHVVLPPQETTDSEQWWEVPV